MNHQNLYKINPKYEKINRDGGTFVFNHYQVEGFRITLFLKVFYNENKKNNISHSTMNVACPRLKNFHVYLHMR